MSESLSGLSRRNPSSDSLKRKLAEHSTLHSRNEYVSLRSNCSGSFEAIALYYVSLYYKIWQTDVIVRKIAQMAYANNYQGRWKRVQEILELPINRPEQLEEYYIKEGHNKDFYGNLLPLAVRIAYALKEVDTSKEIRRRVRYPQRVRGYRDKGSRRLPHERHGEDIPGTESPREDRRQFVHHPLVGNGTEQPLAKNQPDKLFSLGRKEESYDFNSKDKKGHPY